MSDDWHYSHKNENGYDVNAYGYDKNGVFRGSAPYFNSSNNNQTIFKKKKFKAAGGGGLVWLIIIIFIIIKALEFLEKNWVSVAAILCTVILCIIICLIIKRKFAFISICIIIGIIYLGPIQKDGNFERWRNNKTIYSEEN
jgi:hypothetical protein